MNDAEAFEWYARHWSGFLSDFWQDDNRLLTITVEPRKDVESGKWYEAIWWTKDNARRGVVAQTERLMKERIIKRYLQDCAASRHAEGEGE